MITRSETNRIAWLIRTAGNKYILIDKLANYFEGICKKFNRDEFVDIILSKEKENETNN